MSSHHFNDAIYHLDYPKLPSVDSHTYIRDSIVCLHFYLARCEYYSICYVSEYYENLLEYVIFKVKNESYAKYIYYLLLLYKIIGQTRDIQFGKGEKDLSYMLIAVWYKFDKMLAMSALRTFVEHPYSFGCWSDIKYFCEFIRIYTSYDNIVKERIYDCAISFMIYQFDKDQAAWDNAIFNYLQKVVDNAKIFVLRPDARDIISNVAKWIPRESNKYGWLYEKIVVQWNLTHCPYLFENVEDYHHYEKVVKKCKMKFRKMMVKMNKELDTTEIKQCSKRWSDIEPERVSVTTLLKYKKAFTKSDSLTSTNVDRINSTFTFKDHFFNNGEPSMTLNHKSTHLSIGFYVKQAMKLLSSVYTDSICAQIAMLNKIWKKNILNIFQNCNDKINMLAIIDISRDISDESRNNAIGMGILISQISKINKIILVEQQYYCCNALFNSEFTDIICNILPYLDSATKFDISHTINFMNLGSNLLEEPILHILLSDSNNILKHKDVFFKESNKYITNVFWSVKTNINKENEDVAFDQDKGIFLSGSSPASLYQFNKYFKSTSFEYISTLLDAPRYSNLADLFLKYFT